jgi:dTDP-4-dehydrorhamnose reductase
MTPHDTRVLVLGGGGMLGHKLSQTLSACFEVWSTVRRGGAEYARFGVFAPGRLIEGVDASRMDSVRAAISAVRPAVIINCIGILKQLPAAHDPVGTIEVNALFPQRLSLDCRDADAWLIHLSTDCVFSGRKGHYAESDVADAEDLYGRTKLLGEPTGTGTLVLRTSMIGRELSTSTGLAEWFIAHRGGRVKGYRRARFSGLTTIALAGVIRDLILLPTRLTGLYHVGTADIDKYDLLCRLNDALGLDICTDMDDSVVIDRSLDSTRFWSATSLPRPDWAGMIAAMAADPTPYDRWRNT